MNVMNEVIANRIRPAGQIAGDPGNFLRQVGHTCASWSLLDTTQKRNLAINLLAGSQIQGVGLEDLPPAEQQSIFRQASGIVLAANTYCLQNAVQRSRVSSASMGGWFPGSPASVGTGAIGRTLKSAGQAVDMDFTNYYTPVDTPDTTSSYGYDPLATKTQDAGMTPAQQTALLNTIGGALNTAGTTIASIIRGNNAVEIARLNNDTNLAIARLQADAARAASAGNQALAAQQADRAAELQRFQQTYLTNQRPSYTGLYVVAGVVAVGIIGAFAYLATRPKHNPTRSARPVRRRRYA